VKSFQVVAYRRMIDRLPKEPTAYPICEECGAQIRVPADGSVREDRLYCWKCLDAGLGKEGT